jgi:broad specificity phosphatase PhoE
MNGTTRLILVRHASTEAVRRGAFPLDEPLDGHGAADAAAASAALPRVNEAWCGPSTRTRQTAHALGLDARVDAALDECDFGHWSGRLLADLHAENPDAVAAWMGDPTAAPHGGESIVDLLDRVSAWLSARAGRDGRTLAVTHAGFIRAAIVVALGAPAQAFWRVDIAPLSQTVLHERDGHWTLRRMGTPA